MTQEKAKRPRGTGRIFTPKGSRFLWIQFYQNGKVIRESTHTTEQRKAERILAHRLAEVATHTFVQPKRITVAELYADVLQDYKDNGHKSIDDLVGRWEKHLKPFFGNLLASNVRGETIRKYRAQRQAEVKEGQNPLALNSTINREVSVLRRTYTLGLKNEKIAKAIVPTFPDDLVEPDARRGHLDDTQIDNLCLSCSDVGLWLRGMVEVARQFGCRVGELKGLRVCQVDLDAKVLRLERTKNGEDRSIGMTSEMFALLQQCITGKGSDDLVFTHDDGTPIGDFRKVWATACKRAGVPELLFHDLRRTAARNMRRRGISEEVAMRIGGWKTRSVFDRYRIVDEQDLRDAARKMEEAEQVRARTSIVAPALRVVGGIAVH